MFPSIHPKQYQDVKANLNWYTTIILALIGFILYLFFLPPEHKQTLNTIFGQIPSSQIVGSGIILAIFGFIGWLFVFCFEFHDKVYDRYFVKWRFYYDLYFILPYLVRPFAHKLDKRFFDEAENHRDDFMKPFYHFVADYEHEHKIKQNLIVRFYEIVTKYWITQMNEIMLFLLLLVNFAYFFVYTCLKIPLNPIVVMNFIVMVLFLLNRLAVKKTKISVWKATSDEIEEIHNSFMDELDEELRKLSKKFNLNYGKV